MGQPRSILITGASSGLGEALARHFAGPGVALHLGGRSGARLAAVAAAAEARGARVATRRVDVTDKAAMADWVGRAVTDDAVDLVIANAGISGGTGEAWEPEEQARDIFAVNLAGVLNTVHPAVAAMRARPRPSAARRGARRGAIAVMASLAGYLPLPGAPAYSASKAAALTYGLALRGALAGDGIAVSVLCPGFVKSPMTDANAFPMPFLMDTPKAARIMARGIARERAVIAFPWQTRLAVGLMRALPFALTARALTRLPKKG